MVKRLMLSAVGCSLLMLASCSAPWAPAGWKAPARNPKQPVSIKTVAAAPAGPVKITYQLPRTPTPQTYRVTIAIARADQPEWIARTLLSGAVREVTADNKGAFTETWDGLDEDGYPVKPGRYTWKGVYMPAVKWAVDGKYHTFTARLAVAAGSTFHTQPAEDTHPMVFQGVSTSPINDVWAMPDGKMLFAGEYIENGSNPFYLDPEARGIKQVIWGSPSGGVGGVNACAADADYAYVVSSQGENDLITRYDMTRGGRLPFGSDKGTYLGNICYLPKTPDGGRDTAVSMAALKTAAGKHYLYVPMLRGNKLIVLDGESGQKATEVAGLVSPRGIRLDPARPESGLFVLCTGAGGAAGGFIVARIGLSEGLPQGAPTTAATLEGLDAQSLASMGDVIDPVWNSERAPFSAFSQSVNTWKSRLQPALGLAVDRQGNFYVGNQIANQIWKYAPTGRLSLKIGKEGGQQAGRFEPAAMRCPAGIAIRYDSNGAGHLVVAERVVWQRVSQWGLDGSLERDWYISSYGFPIAPDPENPKDVYVAGDWPGMVRYKVDYQTGEWKIDAVWPREPANIGDGLMYGNTARLRVYHLDGRTFLVASCAFSSKYIYEVDGYRLTPRSSIGSYLLKVLADRIGLSLEGVPRFQLNLGFGPTDVYFKPWTWRDTNGDGREQLEEIDLSQPPVIPPCRNVVEVTRRFSSYWGEYYDENLNLLLPEAGDGGTRYAMIPRSGWDSRGNPIYSWKNLKLLFDDAQLAAEGYGDPGFGAVAAGPDGSYYRTEFYGPPAPGGVDHGADYSFAKLARFRPDGKGGYRLAWRVGKHARGIAQPGEMYVPSQVSEPINGIVGVHDLNGVFHLFTTDGLYLDTILNDAFAHSPPRTAYDLDGEMFGGRMFVNKKDGQAYLLQGHRAATIFQIENLTAKGRVREIPNKSEGFTLLASQIAPAPEWALEKQGKQRLLVVTPASGGAPALDGSMAGWSQSKPAAFSLDANHQVEARVMFDPANIYVRYHVRTAGPPNYTTAGNLARCFTHEARTDVVGFYIQGDSTANPGRTSPAEGDARFLLALVAQQQGTPKPAVIGMYAVFPGGTHPMIYSSPIGKAGFEEVRILTEAEAGYVMDKDGNGFTIAAAIPLRAIPKLAPHAGLVTGMNFDAVFASGVRVWWSNTGADPAATLMSDEFSEARIYPQIWGQAQFAAPSLFIVTRWSVVGPFGSVDMAKRGDDLNYVMPNLAGRVFPPQEQVDLKATYSGDITRDWKGTGHTLAWKQIEAVAGGWVRLDQAWGLAGDDSRGAGFAAAWVYVPAPTKLKLDVEGHGIVWAHRLWVNGQEVAREAVPGAGAHAYRITSGQQVELKSGWNLILLRGDSWAHSWLFEQHGGWGFRVTLSGPETEMWKLRAADRPPD